MHIIKVILFVFTLISPFYSTYSNTTLLDKKHIQFVQKKLQQLPELRLILTQRQYLSPDLYHNRTLAEDSWSQLIGYDKRTEFNKTLASLYNLSLIIDGSKHTYQEFVLPQSEDNILLPESFQMLHSNFKLYNNMKSLIELNLLIRDIGKSSEFHKLAKQKCNIQEDDTHILVKRVLAKCPELCKSFDSLSKQDKEILQIANSLHLGHFINVEGGLEMLNELANSKKNYTPRVHNILIATNIAELSAYKAHIHPYGSASYNQLLFEVTNKALNAIKTINSQSKQAVIKQYLHSRFAHIELPKDIVNIGVIMKIAVLAKINTQKDIFTLIHSLEQLASEQKEKIFKVLDPYKNYGFTPTYLPAIFDNIKFIMRQEGDSNKDIISYAVKYALPFIASVLHSELDDSAQYSRVISFKKVSSQILENLNSLETGNFIIDKNGLVSIIQNI